MSTLRSIEGQLVKLERKKGYDVNGNSRYTLRFYTIDETRRYAVRNDGALAEQLKRLAPEKPIDGPWGILIVNGRNQVEQFVPERVKS